MRCNVGRLAARYGLTTLSLLVTLLAGCDAPHTDEFVGTWNRVKYPKETLTVTKQADRTLVFSARDYAASDSQAGQVGQLIGDQVVIDERTTATLRTNGNLVYDGREYIR